MSLGVLNNISALYAQNNLNQTQSSLQKALTQLSSGSKINSGADDAAGLSIANGLAANSAALTQSSSNASAGVGFLQVADGALSQVTNLLSRAVTLATEAGGGTLTDSQLNAANQEYTDILNQIGTIGTTTQYNGKTVFNAAGGGPSALTTADFTQAGGAGHPLVVNLTQGDSLSGSIAITSSGGGTGSSIIDLGGFSGLASNDQPTANAAATALQTAMNSASGLHGQTNSTYVVSVAAGVVSITSSNALDVLSVTASSANQTPPNGGVMNIYTSDGTSTGSHNYDVTAGALTTANVGSSLIGSAAASSITVTVGGVTGTGGQTAGNGTGTSLTGTTITNQANAEAALQTVDDAINAVAYQRGQVGANINTLNAASNIASAEQTNVESAQNTITATDYAATTSNMSKYEILTQTGISALAQANSTQQMVTKLLQ
jgi:flagellin